MLNKTVTNSMHTSHDRVAPLKKKVTPPAFIQSFETDVRKLAKKQKKVHKKKKCRNLKYKKRAGSLSFKGSQGCKEVF